MNLGPDHDTALEQWHRIEAGIVTKPTSADVQTCTVGDAIYIGQLVESFLAKSGLDKLSKSRAATTTRILNDLAGAMGGHPVAWLRVNGSDKVNRWLDSHKTWGSKADVIGHVKKLFNWATREGLIPSSPLLSLAKPQFGQRVTVFTPEQVAAILDNCHPNFAIAFQLLLLTGCRPAEICLLQGDDVHHDASGYYLLVAHKNQHHTGKPRRVFLVPEAVEIITGLQKKNPHGPLLRSGARTATGYPPLSAEYFCHAMRDVCKIPACAKLGLDGFRVVAGKRLYDYVPYTARHTFAVRYLTGFYRDSAGKPIILNYGEVAALLGNTAKMIEKIYGHLVDQTKFLTDRLTGQL